jgi:acetyl-CoA carboxylase biotin carboxyl carrier protein
MARQEVQTPIPGVFYRRPSPDEDEFVQEGDDVESGATIGLVEIMKNFQEVETEVTGKLVEFLVANEDEVTAGQAIAVVDDGE